MKSKAKKKLSGEIGTLNAEVLRLAANDMISRGWEVYGSLSPTNSFDLVIYKDGKYYSVDVAHMQGDAVVPDQEAFTLIPLAGGSGGGGRKKKGNRKDGSNGVA